MNSRHKENDGLNPNNAVSSGQLTRTVESAMGCHNISSIHHAGFSYRKIETHSNGTITKFNQTKKVLASNKDAQNIGPKYNPFLIG